MEFKLINLIYIIWKQQTLAENYEAMGLGGGLEGIEEQECSNMFYDGI